MTRTKPQVQIDRDLFVDIVKLVVFDHEELRESVSDRLQNKVDRLAAHQRYSKNLNGENHVID